MSKIIKANLVWCAIIFLSIHTSFAQSANINYTYLSLSDCNCFGTGPTVENYKHQTTIGYPKYSTSENGIVLQCSPSSGNKANATQYAINYNFKKGVQYKVTVNAKSNATTQTGSAMLDVRPITNAVPNALASCFGPEPVTNIFSGPFISSSWANYGVMDNIMDKDYSWLAITALAGSGASAPINISIRTLKIEEILPEFSISQSAESVVIGGNSSITFTVNNPNNITNITSYEWNLGSANNGWEYNGSTAPQNISTAGNSISLTTPCGDVTNPVSVTVKVNNASYKTYTFKPISKVSPTYSITGPDNLCSSATYEIQGLPAGATIIWSATPGWKVNLTPNGNSVSVAKISDAREIKLSAQVTSTCGIVPLINKTISVGLPVTFDYSPSTNIVFNEIKISNANSTGDFFCSNLFAGNRMQIVNLYEDVSFVIEQIQLLKLPQMSVIRNLPGGSDIDFGSVPVGLYYIHGTWRNSCGSNSFDYQVESMNCSSGGIRPPGDEPVVDGMLFSASPNPTTSIINIEATQPPTEDYDIQLFDLYNSNPVLKQKSMKGNKKTQLQVSHLRKGQYILVIKNKKGEIIKKQQMILQ